MMATVIVGDSIVRHVPDYSDIKVICYPGWTVERAERFLASRKGRETLGPFQNVVLHVGTNNLEKFGAQGTAALVLSLRTLAGNLFPSKRFFVSAPIVRSDRLTDQAATCSRILRRKGAFVAKVLLTRGPSGWQAKDGVLKRDRLHLTDLGAKLFARSLEGHLASIR